MLKITIGLILLGIITFYFLMEGERPIRGTWSFKRPNITLLAGENLTFRTDTISISIDDRYSLNSRRENIGLNQVSKDSTENFLKGFSMVRDLKAFCGGNIDSNLLYFITDIGEILIIRKIDYNSIYFRINSLPIITDNGQRVYTSFWGVE